jgi:hypothetical protein
MWEVGTIMPLWKGAANSPYLLLFWSKVERQVDRQTDYLGLKQVTFNPRRLPKNL